MNKIKLLPLGGLGEFGKNMFLVEDEHEILIMDCGVGFPEEYLKGIDLLIPDFAYLKNLTKEKKLYMLITHAHEDHIGAIPFFIEHFRADIYASPFTCAFIHQRLSRYEKAVNEIFTIMPFQKVKTKNFEFYTIPVTHSVPDCCSYVLETRAGRILFTGDFKIDSKPFYGKPFDIKPFQEEGKRGIDLLIMDSTNSISSGRTESESTLYEPIKKIFQSADRLVFSTFSSHIDRVGLLIKLCKEFNRKLFVSGRGFETSIEISENFGFLDGLQDVLKPVSEMQKFSNSEICFLATGSQGEYRSAMYRIFDNSHADLKIRNGDTVIISSKIIPGNEKTFFRMVNSLTKLGAKVFHEANSNVHVSGHAKQEELLEMLNAIQPKSFLPAHGDYIMLEGNADLAKSVGVTKIILIENGQEVIWSKDSFELATKHEMEMSLIEADSRNAIDYETTKDRLKIGQYGLVLCSVIKDHGRKKLIPSKTIEVLGLSSKCKDKKIIDQAYQALREGLQECSFSDDFNTYKESLRVKVRKVFKDNFDMKPVTIIQEHDLR